MFKTIEAARNLAALPVYIAGVDKDSRRYRKERKARLAAARQYNEMIAESQAKIGPYVPVPCPVQIWA